MKSYLNMFADDALQLAAANGTEEVQRFTFQVFIYSNILTDMSECNNTNTSG